MNTLTSLFKDFPPLYAFICGCLSTFLLVLIALKDLESTGADDEDHD